MVLDRFRQAVISQSADDLRRVYAADAVQEFPLGTSAAIGEVTLPNIVVLTVRDGQIVRLRDYVNILAALAAVGLD